SLKDGLPSLSCVSPFPIHGNDASETSNDFSDFGRRNALTDSGEVFMPEVTGIQSGTLTSLSSRSLLRREVAAGRPRWPTTMLIFGPVAAVAYADFIASSVSLGYLYILPLGISAMFLRTQISYALIAATSRRNSERE